MKLGWGLLALVASLCAVNAQDTLEGACEFASTSPRVLALSQDVSRVSTFSSPVKFLFDNKQCTDFMLCMDDSSLSGGSGCAIAGARSESGSVCSIRGTHRGDGTYMLALEDSSCTGLDLVNCININSNGVRMEISQSCAANITSMTFTCLGCQAISSDTSIAIAGAAVDGVSQNAQNTVNAATRKKYGCDKYGWCGHCNCPDPGPKPDKTCVATCKGRSNCTPIDNTFITKTDTKRCSPVDTTRCELNCNDPPQPAPVICPAFKAEATLRVWQADDDGNWVLVNVNGENPYESVPIEKPCPRCPSCIARPGQAPGLCTAVKTGTCSAESTGSCQCSKGGSCDVQAGPPDSRLIACPSSGGISFTPCDGGCKQCPEKDKGKDWDHDYGYGKDKYPSGTKPYPPDFPFGKPPKDVYGKPPKDCYNC